MAFFGDIFFGNDEDTPEPELGPESKMVKAWIDRFLEKASNDSDGVPGLDMIAENFAIFFPLVASDAEGHYVEHLLTVRDIVNSHIDELLTLLTVDDPAVTNETVVVESSLESPDADK